MPTQRAGLFLLHAQAGVQPDPRTDGLAPLAGEAPGSEFRRDLFVVNDFHRPYPALQVKWQIRDASGAPLLEQEMRCSVASNSLTKVAEVAR